MQDSIVLNSKTAASAFRSIQTIRQIIPQISNDTLGNLFIKTAKSDLKKFDFTPFCSTDYFRE
jgi:hypothetical protein